MMDKDTRSPNIFGINQGENNKDWEARKLLMEEIGVCYEVCF